MVTRFQSVISEEIKWQLKKRKAAKTLTTSLLVLVVVAMPEHSYHFTRARHIIAVEAAGKGVNSGQSAATSKLGKK
jgi:tryptophan synthase beta chain